MGVNFVGLVLKHGVVIPVFAYTAYAYYATREQEFLKMTVFCAVYFLIILFLEYFSAKKRPRVFSEGLPGSVTSGEKVVLNSCEGIFGAKDVQAITEYIYNTINGLTSCTRCYIYMQDSSDLLGFTCKYRYGVFSVNNCKTIRERDIEFLSRNDIKDIIVRIDVQIAEEGGRGDRILVPMISSSEIIGVIIAESDAPRKFEKVDKKTLKSLAGQMAVAIQNILRQEQNSHQKIEIEKLREALQLANSDVSKYINELGIAREELNVKNIDIKLYYEEMHIGYLQTVMALANSIEAKDAYTRGHCQRVMEISCEIATQMGLGKQQIDDIRYAAILHDIGKIGIRADIINKGGRLTEEEFEEIKKHPLIAYDILRGVKFLRNGIDAILQHHERFDGTGYPHGMKGKDIGLYGRILGIADSIDAMTSDRPYRKGMSMEAALKEIERCKGTQFDPEVSDILLSLSSKLIN